MEDHTAMSTDTDTDIPAPAEPVPDPPAGIHGEQPDSSPPGGGSWSWVPGIGWVAREL